ncbi:family 2 glycosyl transferase, partial [Streptomyces carpinensis]
PAVTGEGRRARRLRAQEEAEQAAQEAPSPDPGVTPPPAEEAPAAVEEAPAAVPHQPSYGEWDTTAYAGAAGAGTATEYGAYGGEPYQTIPDQAQQYPAGAYDQAYQDGQAGPYQGGQYDPYAYGGQAPASYDHTTYHQGYEEPYDPAQHHAHDHTHGIGSERPDGSQQ